MCHETQAPIQRYQRRGFSKVRGGQGAKGQLVGQYIARRFLAQRNLRALAGDGGQPEYGPKVKAGIAMFFFICRVVCGTQINPCLPRVSLRESQSLSTGGKSAYTAFRLPNSRSASLSRTPHMHLPPPGTSGLPTWQIGERTGGGNFRRSRAATFKNLQHAGAEVCKVVHI